MKKRQPTMADLARELGVSTATISRALKDYPDISSETKRRVIELADKLNYRPNSFAASLRKNESRIIGVIIPEVVNHFFSSVIKGIMEEVYEAGYRVMLCQSDESYEKEVKDAEALLNSRVDGLLVSLATETVHLDHFRDFLDLDIPIVFFDKVPLDFQNCSKVIVDDYEGALNAVAHLISQGYRRIAHIGGPFGAYTAKLRLRGYRAALAQAGIPYDEHLVTECHDVSHEEGVHFANLLLDTQEPIDAFFCVTDDVAIGALTALKARGIAIPQEMAVVGFSNWKMSAVVEPPLSSVDQPGFEMGTLAAQTLLAEIEANKDDRKVAHQVHTLKTSLKVRASSRRKVVG
jgi:LacI family transcriptional regulator